MSTSLNMLEQELVEPNTLRRQFTTLGIIVLYVLIIVSIDVGFVIFTQHANEDSITALVINKTSQHLDTMIRTAFVVQQEEHHVLSASDKQRSIAEKVDPLQNSSTEETTFKGYW